MNSREFFEKWQAQQARRRQRRLQNFNFILLSLAIIFNAVTLLHINSKETVVPTVTQTEIVTPEKETGEVFTEKRTLKYLTKDNQEVTLKYTFSYEWVPSTNPDVNKLPEGDKHLWLDNYLRNGLIHYLNLLTLDQLMSRNKNLKDIAKYCDIQEINKHTIPLGIKIIELKPLELKPVKKIKPKKPILRKPAKEEPKIYVHELFLY